MFQECTDQGSLVHFWAVYNNIEWLFMTQPYHAKTIFAPSKMKLVFKNVSKIQFRIKFTS